MVRIKLTKKNEITLEFEDTSPGESGAFQNLAVLFDLTHGTTESNVTTTPGYTTSTLRSITITVGENNPNDLNTVHDVLRLLLYATDYPILIEPGFYAPTDPAVSIHLQESKPEPMYDVKPRQSPEDPPVMPEPLAEPKKSLTPNENLEKLITTYQQIHSIEGELKFTPDETFSNEALKLYQAEILYPLEQEKRRLEERKKKKHQERKNIGEYYYSPTPIEEARKELIGEELSYTKRIAAFSEAIAQIQAGIMNPKPNYLWVNDVDNPIEELLKNPDLEKSKSYKWLRGVANAVAFLFTGILPGVIKYAATDSLFFSMQGDSKNTAQKVSENRKKLHDASQKGGDEMKKYSEKRLAAHNKRLAADTKKEKDVSKKNR